jgi:uncharacterized pyridoxal phosphate-containing UPF0001 family protein
MQRDDQRLNIRGLMTVGPLTTDKKALRESFDLLFELFNRTRDRYGVKSFDTVSMGMSGDYEEAVAAGSTLVRIGSALFK